MRVAQIAGQILKEEGRNPLVLQRNAIAHTLALAGKPRQYEAVMRVRTLYLDGQLSAPEVFRALRRLVRDDVHAATLTRLVMM